jgi:septal ring factor EnvC (AmiA/AmiB activator)
MKHLLVALAIAACGGKSDDCQRLADKLTTIPKELFGRDADRLVTACRQDVARAHTDPTTGCILRADDDAAVLDCMVEGSRRESAEALRKAEAERDAANAAVAAARKQLEKVQAELDAADERVAKGVSAVANAQDRKAIELAQQQLAKLQAEQHELRKRVVEAQAAANAAGNPSPPLQISH